MKFQIGDRVVIKMPEGSKDMRAGFNGHVGTVVYINALGQFHVGINEVCAIVMSGKHLELAEDDEDIEAVDLSGII